MPMLETRGFDQVEADIQCALDQIEDYANYGDTQGTIDHFEELHRHTPDGVTIEIDTVAHQLDEKGEKVPLKRIDIDLGTDGYALYEKGGVHFNELAWQLTFKETGNVAMRHPDMLRALGIGRIVLFGAERVVSDRNTWHLGEATITSYLRSAMRGDDPVEWCYPVEYDGYSFAGDAPGCLASQDIIQEIHPRLIAPLHNAAMSGPYAQIRNHPESLPENLSIALRNLYHFPFGYPDIQPTQQHCDGVYSLPSWRETYEHQKSQGSSMLLEGADSISFAEDAARRAELPAPFGLLVEPPYFLPLSLKDNRGSGLTYREAYAAIVDRTSIIINKVNEFAPRILTDDNPYPWIADEINARLNKWNTDLESLRAAIPGEPDVECGIGSAANVYRFQAFYPTMPFGLLCSLADKLGSPQARALNALFGLQTDFLNFYFRPAAEKPQRLVQTQLGCILLSAAAITRSQQ